MKDTIVWYCWEYHWVLADGRHLADEKHVFPRRQDREAWG